MKCLVLPLIVGLVGAFGRPLGHAPADFVLKNCTMSCPPADPPPMCWDTSVWTGDCTETGEVYTELHLATNCSNGCWRMVSMVYEGTNERSQLNHNIFVKMIDKTGNYINSYPNGPYWTAFYGPSWDKHDGETPKLEVKGQNDWGDFPLWASDPDWEPETCHCCGSYGAFAGDVMSNSDVLYGAGMPVHHHVNWLVLWQWMTN